MLIFVSWKHRGSVQSCSRPTVLSKQSPGGGGHVGVGRRERKSHPGARDLAVEEGQVQLGGWYRRELWNLGPHPFTE